MATFFKKISDALLSVPLGLLVSSSLIGWNWIKGGYQGGGRDHVTLPSQSEEAKGILIGNQFLLRGGGREVERGGRREEELISNLYPSAFSWPQMCHKSLTSLWLIRLSNDNDISKFGWATIPAQQVPAAQNAPPPYWSSQCTTTLDICKRGLDRSILSDCDRFTPYSNVPPIIQNILHANSGHNLGWYQPEHIFDNGEPPGTRDHK